MSRRYPSEDHDDYYDDRYRDRGYEGLSADYRGSDDRYVRDYQSDRRLGSRDEPDRYNYYGGSQSREPGRDQYRESYGSDRPSSRSQSARDRSWENNTNGMGSTGLHRGKGPKGYTRSDERIKEDISDALMEDADLDASEIEVVVKKGEVTLQGQVSSRQDKRKAEDHAHAQTGVSDVQNNIKVRSSAQQAVKSAS